ncbi:Smr/MutS family protein [Aquimonas sp.]|jgi:DNA-nicking Smr family endonuclease|uniref:Smr/MutS family protein n=1 Tax=Aquimonas sp. TaxID=1872588 RepID=UPI0037C079AF
MSRRPSKPTAAPVHPSDDDLALFHEAIGPVRRIEVEEAAAAASAPRPAPRPRQREADERQAGEDFRLRPFEFAIDGLGDGLEYLAAGHSPRILKELKRGQFAVQDELDLHRMNAGLADECIRVFLAEANQRGFRCVRIIHGKGLRSKDSTPVLKLLTDKVLRFRADVLAFASARPAEGGTGAVVVLLRRPRTQHHNAESDDGDGR